MTFHFQPAYNSVEFPVMEKFRFRNKIFVAITAAVYIDVYCASPAVINCSRNRINIVMLTETFRLAFINIQNIPAQIEIVVFVYALEKIR